MYINFADGQHNAIGTLQETEGDLSVLLIWVY